MKNETLHHALDGTRELERLAPDSHCTKKRLAPLLVLFYSHRSPTFGCDSAAP